jgi:xanthine/uracil permease
MSPRSNVGSKTPLPVQEPTVLDRIRGYGDLASTVLLMVGAFASVFVGLAGALVMLAGFAGSLAIHLVVGIVEYRRVMARPWPAVPALGDEDDW